MLYGHPFETVNAVREEKTVTDFFLGDFSPAQMQDLINAHGVDYIFFGPRERILGPILIPDSWMVTFQSADVMIYSPEKP